MTHNNENIGVYSNMNASHECDTESSPLNEEVAMENISRATLTKDAVHSTDINQESLCVTPDAVTALCKLKMKNMNKPLVGHLNINGIHKKFESLKTLVESKINIFVVSETKIDSSFHPHNFC